jgi:iron(III) transport system permease protein
MAQMHDATVKPLPLSIGHWLVILLSLPLLLPLLAIAYLALSADGSAWPFLLTDVLPHMVWQTLLLCFGTGFATLVIGTLGAYLVTFHDFPLRGLLSWSAILPLAMPGYIIAFVVVDSFAYSGFLQGLLRDWLGWTSPQNSFVPDVRSIGGAILVMALTLYPYVYLSARAAFLRQPMSQIAVARTLGRSSFRAFFEITLPQARPALAVGVSLVMMECLNDIGAMQFFGVNTLTLGIYSTWLGRGDLGSAAQLAIVMLAGVIGLILFEVSMRNRDGLSRVARAALPAMREPLRGVSGIAATIAVGLPVILGFILPVALLLRMGFRRFYSLLSTGFVQSLQNSLMMAALACAGTLLLALIFASVNRNHHNRGVATFTRLASLGYAIPGTILAIGLLLPFGFLDGLINLVTQQVFDVKVGLLLSGSIFTLFFAYVTRFLIIAYGQVEAGMEKISPHLDQVARTLGRSPRRVFFEITLPLLRPSLVTAALLVFVDAMKELPATLLLRPFDFETLATHVFTLSSLGQLEESALPALAIVAAGLIPVYVLSRHVRDHGQS